MNWSSEVHVVDTWFPALEAFVPGWEKFLEPHTLRVWFCSRDSGEHFFEDEPGRWRPFFYHNNDDVCTYWWWHADRNVWFHADQT